METTIDELRAVRDAYHGRARAYRRQLGPGRPYTARQMRRIRHKTNRAKRG